MNQPKKAQWDTIGKISILVFALGMALFFPFQKYLSSGANKNKLEKTEEPDMTSAILDKEPVERDYNKEPQIYWRRRGEGYLVYVNGKQVNDLESSWSGDDLLVRDLARNVTYRLPNFKNLRDNQLREGEIAKTGQR